MSAWEHVHGKFQKVDAPYEEGKRFSGGGVQPTRGGTRGPQVTKVDPEDGFGVVRALDPKTGELKWEFPMPDVTASGILTTASDVLFTGGRQGYFHALDARTGKLLWKVAAGGEIAMGPMTYEVNGKAVRGLRRGQFVIHVCPEVTHVELRRLARFSSS